MNRYQIFIDLIGLDIILLTACRSTNDRVIWQLMVVEASERVREYSGGKIKEDQLLIDRQEFYSCDSLGIKH